MVSLLDRYSVPELLVMTACPVFLKWGHIPTGVESPGLLAGFAERLLRSGLELRP